MGKVVPEGGTLHVFVFAFEFVVIFALLSIFICTVHLSSTSTPTPTPTPLLIVLVPCSSNMFAAKGGKVRGSGSECDCGRDCD